MMAILTILLRIRATNGRQSTRHSLTRLERNRDEILMDIVQVRGRALALIACCHISNVWGSFPGPVSEKHPQYQGQGKLTRSM